MNLLWKRSDLPFLRKSDDVDFKFSASNGTGKANTVY